MTVKKQETAHERAFREGAEARLDGRLDDAIALFSQSLEECPRDDEKLLGAIHGMLSSVERKQGKPDIAEQYSRRAIKYLPSSQLASVGLFHALWDQGKCAEALGEVVRLVSLRDSQHYRELLSCGFCDGLSAELLALVDKTRNTLSSCDDDV